MGNIGNKVDSHFNKQLISLWLMSPSTRAGMTVAHVSAPVTALCSGPGMGPSRGLVAKQNTEAKHFLL